MFWPGIEDVHSEQSLKKKEMKTENENPKVCYTDEFLSGVKDGRC